MILILIFLLISITAALWIAVACGWFSAGVWIWKFLLAILGSYVGVNLLFFLLGSFGMLFVNLNTDVPKPTKFNAWLEKEMAQLVCIYVGTKSVIHGEEKIPEDTRFLMISNHRSNMDPFYVLAWMSKYNIAFISKFENFKIPFIGKLMHLCCHLPIDRENARNALKTINRAAKYIRDDIVSFMIYPEGHRTKKKEMLPFHAGSLKIAQKAGVPIVVTSIAGTEKIFHRPFHRTKVTMDILKVIPAKEVRARKTTDLTPELQTMIEEHLRIVDSEN
jgi:1-acyl-sn-glycerol-3-phosphate acyltransferase